MSAGAAAIAGAKIAGAKIAGTAAIGSSILGLGNASTGYGYGQGENIGIGNGYGYSTSGASGSSSSWNNSYGQSISSSSNWGNSSGGSQSSSQYNVYGSEASARDILRANEANAVQQKMWEEQARFNAEEAQINRDFQEYMANTAYQRAVVDLLKAGLNPILAVGNMGAMTPVGAQASSGLAGAHKAQTFADAESSSSSSSWDRSSWGGSSSSKSYNESKGGSKSSYNATSASRNKYANMTYGYNYNMYNNSNNIANVAKTAIGKIGDMMRNPVPTPTH